LSLLKPHFKLRFAAIAAIAVLIAQLGAVAHAYAHVADLHPASTYQANTGSHDFCSDCLSFAPLLSAAGAPAALPLIEPPGRGAGVHAECRSLVDRHLHLAFRSRAPPIAH
jgi:hypothetical protein